MERVNDRVSYIVLLAVGALCILSFALIRLPRAMRAEHSLISGDGPGYYSYLRSFVFDRDLDFRNEYRHFDFDVQGTTPTGLMRNPWSVGPAVLWAPLYLLAHAISLSARTLGVQASVHGYGYVYESAVSVSTMLYVTAGCLLIYRVCRRHFSPYSSLLAILGIWLASTLTHYTVSSSAMSHGVSFFAVSLFLFLWHPPRCRTYKEWAILGLSAGLMGLVRQENLPYLGLVGVEAITTTATTFGGTKRMHTLAHYLKGVAIAGIAALLVFAPQMLAWSILYGSAIAFTHPADVFDWLHPDLLEYLFCPRPGFYVWTPIMLLATVGFVPLWRRDKAVTMALLVPLVLVWYLLSSIRVTYHDYEWAFGARRATSTAALLGLGIAALAESVTERLRHGYLIILAVVATLVGWNLLGELQYSLGFISFGEPLSWHDLVVGKLRMLGALIGRVISLP